MARSLAELYVVCEEYSGIEISVLEADNKKIGSSNLKSTMF